MTVDRGGLQYAIVVDDKFSAVTAKFQQELAASEAAWSKFATSGANAALQNARLTEAITKLEGAITAIASAEGRRARASKKSAEAVDEQSAAEKKLEAIIARRAVLEEAHALATERDIDITKKITQEKFLEAAAQERVNKVKLAAAVASRAEQLADEQGVNLSKRKIGAFDLEAAAREKLERAKQRALVQARFEALAVEAGLAAKKKEVAAFDAVAEAARRAARAKQEAEVRDILKGQGLDAQGRPAQAPAAKLPPVPVAEIKRATEETSSLDSAANRVAFTFRRLFGIFAAFQAVRLVFGEIRQAITDSVAFNRQLESAALGIGAIVASTGTVRDALGETVPPVERLRLATSEARKQMQLLREDGRQTAATFEELVEAFQVSIAPGLRAGLNLDQIRSFTVRISQAAGAIGLPQNQLPEEIRSLLSGTIQARTTRIATALSISNEDIRNAKEAGRLFEFLEQRFEGFAAAGRDSLATFSVLMGNLRKNVQEALGTGGEEFFKSLKDFAKFANEGLRTGSLIDPTAVEAVRLIGEGLAAAVEEGRRLMESIGSKTLLIGAEAIGDVLAGISMVVGRIVEGLVKAGASLALILRPLSAIFSTLNSLAGGALGKIVALGAQFLVIAGAIRVAVSSWGAVLRFAAAQAGVVATQMTAGAVAAGLMSRATAFILGPVGLAISGVMLLTSVLGGSKDEAEGVADGLDGAGGKAQTLKQVLETMPAVLRGGTKALEDDAKLMERLKDDAEKAAQALAVAVASVGLRGAVAKQVKESIEGEARAREQSLSLQKQEQQLQQELLRIRQQMAEAQQRFDAQGAFMQGRIKDEEQVLREVLQLRSAVAKAEASAQAAKGTSEELRSVAERDALAERLNYLENNRFKQIYGPEITGIIRDRVVLTGQEKAITDDLAEAARARREVENEIAEIVNKRLRTEAVGETFDARAKSAALEATVAMEASRLELLRRQSQEGRKVADLVGQIADAEAQEREAAAKLALAREASGAEEQRLAALIGAKKAELEGLVAQRESEESSERRLRLSEQIATAEGTIKDLREELSAIMERNSSEIELEERRLRNIVDLVLLRARIEGEEIGRTLRQRNEVAQAELQAERARRGIRDQNEASGFVMLDTTKRILEAESTIAAMRVRMVQAQDAGARRAQELRAARGAAADRGDQALVATLTEQIAQTERETATAGIAAAERIREASEGALAAARERAALEIRAARIAAPSQEAVLAQEQAKVEFLREEEASGFRIADIERTIHNLRYDTQAAQARISAMREEQSLQIAGLEGLLAVTKDEETRKQIIEQINAVRTQGIRLLDIEIAKLRTMSAEAQAAVARDAVRNTRQLTEEGIPQAQGGLDVQRLQNDAARARGARQQVLQVQAEVRAAQTLLSIRRTQAAEQERQIASQIARLRREGAATDTIEAKEKELLAVRELNTLEIEKQEAAIEGLGIKMEEVTSHTAALMDELAATMQSIFSGLAGTISQLLADALDPNKKVDAKEAFRSFFVQMFQQISAFLLQVALLVIALNAIPGFAAVMTAIGGVQELGGAGKVAGGITGKGLPAEGKNEGGRIRGHGQPSLAHRAARGYFLGGRPEGLHPSDTVPIWAAPGEWVIRTAAVSRYGEDVISALNSGLLDPVALRDLAGAHRAAAGPPRIAPPGYAAGGAIRRGSAGSVRTRGGGPAPQMVDEKFADLILGQGGAFGRALQRNKSALRATLGMA